MKKVYGNVVLITGASSGIGRFTAIKLMENGFKVYGTSRKRQYGDEDGKDGKTDCCGDKADCCKGFFRMIQLDVCSEESVEKAVDYVVKKEGSIDILINNAGFGIAGSVEDTTAEEAYSQFNTNFFGALRMCRHVIPVMRRRRRGLIINVGSVAGLISIPFQSMYSASKSALEALTEAMRIELKPFGIKAVLVEPGDTKTGFTGKRQFTAAAVESQVYKEKFTKSINTMIKDETSGPEPYAAANTILRLTAGRNPPVRVTIGFSYKIIVFLKKILPSRLVEFVVSKIY